MRIRAEDGRATGGMLTLERTDRTNLAFIPGSMLSASLPLLCRPFLPPISAHARRRARGTFSDVYATYALLSVFPRGIFLSRSAPWR